MADVNAVLTAFRAELVAAGLVRRPSEPRAVGATPPPPMVNEPPEGPPGPGDDLGDGLNGDPDLVLSLIGSGEVTPANSYDAAAARTLTLDVRYRSKTASALRRAEALDAAIRARLIRPETNYGYGFILADGTPAALLVQAVTVFGGFGPISRSRAGGYDHVAKYAVVVTP
jgi:hypothetical protein